MKVKSKQKTKNKMTFVKLREDWIESEQNTEGGGGQEEMSVICSVGILKDNAQDGFACCCCCLFVEGIRQTELHSLTWGCFENDSKKRGVCFCLSFSNIFILLCSVDLPHLLSMCLCVLCLVECLSREYSPTLPQPSSSSWLSVRLVFSLFSLLFFFLFSLLLNDADVAFYAWVSSILFLFFSFPSPTAAVAYCLPSAYVLLCCLVVLLVGWSVGRLTEAFSHSCCYSRTTGRKTVFSCVIVSCTLNLEREKRRKTTTTQRYSRPSRRRRRSL